MKTALVLIDIQNDYFPNGAMELEGALEASQRAQETLAFFRNRKLPVIHIQHLSIRPGATFFLPETEGVAIHDNVKPLADEPVFQKYFPNSFRETPLLDYLNANGIKQLALAGMMTSMCVDATARAAFDLGFSNILLQDAMATRALSYNGETIPARQVHGSFLAALGAVYGKLMTVREHIELLRGNL